VITATGRARRGGGSASAAWFARHSRRLEKAFARAFFRALKSAACLQALGHTSTYERAVLEQGEYERGGFDRCVRGRGELSAEHANSFAPRGELLG